MNEAVSALAEATRLAIETIEKLHRDMERQQREIEQMKSEMRAQRSSLRVRFKLW